MPATMPSFVQRLAASRAKAEAEARAKALGRAKAEAERAARVQADARAKVVLSALRGRPAREWGEWVSTPEILDALNWPRGRRSYAFIETTMRALGWTPVRTVQRGKRPRHYVRPRGYVRGRAIKTDAI